MGYNHPKSNGNTTKFILVSKEDSLRQLGEANKFRSGVQVQDAENVCDLGVLLNCNLNFELYDKEYGQNCWIPSQKHAFVKKYLGENSARKLVINDFVTIVDY